MTWKILLHLKLVMILILFGMICLYVLIVGTLSPHPKAGAERAGMSILMRVGKLT